MRKKLFVGIAIFAMVFSTCMTGYAQVLITPSVTDAARIADESLRCGPCGGKNGCALRHIPAGYCTSGQFATHTSAPFDWDNDYGYTEIGAQDCKLRFNLCKCENCVFEEGWVMGIQLRIMTTGVYWAADTNVPAFTRGGINCYSEDTHNLRFRRYAENGGCAGTDVSTDANADILRVAYYANISAAENGDSLASAGGTVLRTPTPYDGWEITAEDAARDLCEWQIDMPAMIASGSNITPGATVYVEAKLMFAEPLPIAADGYADVSYLREDPELTDEYPLITTDSNDWAEGTPPYFAQGQYWVNTLNTTLGPVIDGYDKAAPIFHDCTWYSNTTGQACCPINATHPAACDPYYAQDRNLIVDAIADPSRDRFEGTGLCLWKWKDLLCGECEECVCITAVGVLCDEGIITPDTTYCIMFPYVLFGYSDWSSGIGLNRLCDPAANNTPWVSFTLTDCTGTTYTHREDNYNRCLGEAGYTVDQMISEWGWSPNATNDGRGQGWLKVTSNFPLDGYQFNMFNDGSMVFGAGVLAQGCWAACIQGTTTTK
jgi:hypothetical protein